MRTSPNTIPGFVLLVTVAMLSSAYSAQYVGGLRPCILCLYERIPWFVAGGLTLVTALMAFSGPLRRGILLLTAVTLLAGAALAAYHVGVEQHWWAGPGTCSAPERMPLNIDELKALLEAPMVVRCDQIPWEKFGISLAGYNAIISAFTGLVALAGAMRRL